MSQSITAEELKQIKDQQAELGQVVNQIGQLKCTDCDLIGNQCSKNCYHIPRPKQQCVIL